MTYPIKLELQKPATIFAWSYLIALFCLWTILNATNQKFLSWDIDEFMPLIFLPNSLAIIIIAYDSSPFSKHIIWRVVFTFLVWNFTIILIHFMAGDLIEHFPAIAG
jgi:hypothetical protein